MSPARILQQSCPSPERQVLVSSLDVVAAVSAMLPSGFDHDFALCCKSTSGRLCSLSPITILQFLPEQEDGHPQISPLFPLEQHQGIKTPKSLPSQRMYEETQFCCHNKASRCQYFTKSLLLQSQQSSYLSLHTQIFWHKSICMETIFHGPDGLFMYFSSTANNLGKWTEMNFLFTTPNSAF